MISGVVKKMRSFKAFSSKLGRGVMVAVLIAAFAGGYTGTSSYIQACYAQPLPTPPSPPVLGGICACCKTCVTPCTNPSDAETEHQKVSPALETALEAASQTIENYISEAVDTMVEAIYERFHQIELDMISFWQTMWDYGLQPSMQKMTQQLNTATVDQTRTFMGSIDAVEENRTAAAYQEREAETHRNLRVSENACVAGTNAGGLGRANSFDRGMRKAQQKKVADRTFNSTGSVSEKGLAGVIAQRVSDYKDIFCDPQDNGDRNDCAAPDPKYYNADTQVTKRLYNSLTINVDDDPREATVMETIVDNLLGTPLTEPISAIVQKTPTGQEYWLKRRSYFARYAAIRSIPQLIVGHKMPGSNMGQWVKELRDEAKIPLDDISDNPSYREILHAVSIDRFNSGVYANKMIDDKNKIEMEKLTIAAFTLMQLRDYYELLERQALNLSVQVAIMAESTQMPSPNTMRKN
jgi:hypothetical protein